MPPDTIVPSPKPFNDETQRKVEGIQKAPTVPVQDARAAQAFAWAPNQAKQASGIVQTREQETVQKAQKVAANVQTEATKQQIAAAEAEIAAITSQLATLRQQRSQLEAEVNNMRGELSSLQGQISQVNSAAATSQTVPQVQPVVKKGDAYTDPRYKAAEARIAQMVAANDWEGIKAASADRNALLAELNAQGIV